MVAEEGIALNARSKALEMKGISFRYRGSGVYALDSVEIDCLPGEFVGVIGPNGAGKSTLLRIAAGLLETNEGDVFVMGRDIRCLRRRELAALVAFVPTSLYVSFPMTVRELVTLGRIPHLKGVFESKRDRKAVMEALELVHAVALEQRGFQTLSAGEQKRVLMARALAQEPKLLLMDEPTANLDFAQGVFLLERLRALAKDRDIGIVGAIHDFNLALLYCDRIALLSEGRLVASGEPEDVMRYDIFRKVFGCDVYIGRNEINGKLFLVPMRKK